MDLDMATWLSRINLNITRRIIHVKCRKEKKKKKDEIYYTSAGKKMLFPFSEVWKNDTAQAERQLNHK